MRTLISPYDCQWPALFDEERRRLAEALVPWLDGGIRHIGSTAIAGLAAKPIVDMIAGVRDLEEARAAFPPLRQLGYAHDPHRPHEAHHFAKAAAAGSEIRYGLHLTEPGSALWRERLAFRDALRADRALALEYEALKRRLARLHPDDVGAYTDGKRAFVARVLEDAGIELAPPPDPGGAASPKAAR